MRNRIPLKKKDFIPLTFVLIFLMMGCLYFDYETDAIPWLSIRKIDFIRDNPFGNLSRTDVAPIPILASTIDEALASQSPNSIEYIITQDEWDQILQLLKDKDIASGTGGGTWYFAFEGTFLRIYLYHEVS